MSYKTILVHFNSEQQAGELLQVTAAMAKKQDAHVIGLFVVPEFHINPAVAAYVPKEMLSSHKKYHHDKAAKIEAEFNRAMKAGEISSEWRMIDAPTINIAPVVIDHAHMADLVILCQTNEETDDQFISEIPAEVVVGCSRPVLMVPAEGRFPAVGENVMIAWNGTREASKAVFNALPVLKAAQKVCLHRITGEAKISENIAWKDAEFAAMLARHGINIKVTESTKTKHSVGRDLIHAAAAQGADVIVMGGYGHSRTRELIFGGATRHILAKMTLPVLMSH